MTLSVWRKRASSPISVLEIGRAGSPMHHRWDNYCNVDDKCHWQCWWWCWCWACWWSTEQEVPCTIYRWDGDDYCNVEPHALFCLFVLISANNYERHHLSLFFNQNHQEPPCRAGGLFSPKSYKNAGHFLPLFYLLHIWHEYKLNYFYDFFTAWAEGTRQHSLPQCRREKIWG